MKNVVVKSYSAFNFRRYSNPWVARVDERGKPTFDIKIGAYTGGYNRGEAGDLYVFEPVEGAVYAYGQKDYRGTSEPTRYVQFHDGEFARVEKTDLIKVLNAEAHK